jgi:hypothetical protein
MGNTGLPNSGVPEHQVLPYFASRTIPLSNQMGIPQMLWRFRAEKETP